MKRGGTPDEVATALALAAELARKHGIDLAKVNPDEELKSESLGYQWESKYAVLVLKQFFNVRVGWQRYRLTLVGTEWETEIALHVYDFLVGEFRRKWARAKRDHRLRSRRSFLYGMYHGICSKLDEQHQAIQSEPGLIRVQTALKRREQYIALNWGEVKGQSCVPDGDASKAKLTGYLAGRNTNIRPAVGKPQEGRLLA